MIRSCSCRACMNAFERSCSRVAMETLSAGGVGYAVVEFDEPSVERAESILQVLVLGVGDHDRRLGSAEGLVDISNAGTASEPLRSPARFKGSPRPCGGSLRGPRGHDTNALTVHSEPDIRPDGVK